MAKSNGKGLQNSREFAPAISTEGRDAQMSSLAYDLVEQRMRDGTATSQETCYFLKLANPNLKLEKVKLEKQIELLEAKTEQIQAARRMDEVYAQAINAFRLYGGDQEDGEEEL
ncbi:MAG: hypothetical protein J6Y02_19030 [Pseudobutyrivibrio sp.]|nr:hypothetical protein [Pseudobutyrivibrio sp.]